MDAQLNTTTRSAEIKCSTTSPTRRSTRIAKVQQEREGEIQRATIFQFMKLPPELRCMIYAQALAAGTTNILRLSKQVYTEAQRHTYKSAFLRLNIQGVFEGWDEDEDEHFVPWIDGPDLNLIQNVQIDVDYRSLYPGHANVRRLDAFHRYLGGPGSVQRTTCKITLTNTSSFSMHYKAGFGEDMLNIIGSLTDFENVFFMASKGSPQLSKKRRRRTGKALVPANPRFDKYNNWMNEEMYLRVKDNLEAKLGPATYQAHGRAGGGCLTFRPWEWCTAARRQD